MSEIQTQDCWIISRFCPQFCLFYFKFPNFADFVQTVDPLQDTQEKNTYYLLICLCPRILCDIGVI